MHYRILIQTFYNGVPEDFQVIFRHLLVHFLGSIKKMVNLFFKK